MEMNLYEINQELQNCFTVDETTGELFINEDYADLELARRDKLESIACWIKNLASDSEAIEKEIKALTARKSILANTQTKLENLLQTELAGEKFDTPKVAVSFKKSTRTIIDDVEKIPSEFVKVVTDKVPDKTAIKAAINSGKAIEGAHREEKSNIQIK